MGLFDFLSPDKRAATSAAHARAMELQATVPLGTDVSVETRSVPFSARYTVAAVGARGQVSTLVATLAPFLSTLADTEEIEIRVTEAPTEGAHFSSLLVPGNNSDPRRIDSLRRSQASLLALFPEQTLTIEGGYGGFTVSGASRENAVSLAQSLLLWWQDMLRTGLELWPLSEICLEIGGVPDEPEISFAVDLDGAEDDDAALVQVPERAAYAERVIAAANAGLTDLAALAKVGVRHGYGAQIYFSTKKLKPRVNVYELESGDTDEDETTELVDSIRFHHPASQIKA